MDPLYQLYLNMTPEGQRVPALADVTGPRLQDSIRQMRPDVWSAWQQQNAPASNRRPAFKGSINNSAATDLTRSRGSATAEFYGLTDAPLPTGRGGATSRLYAEDGLPVSPGLAAPRPSAIDRIRSGVVSEAERRAIEGYLSGQTSLPRRKGDYRYTGSAVPPDWESILAGLSGGGGADAPSITVDRSLFRLAETPEEAAMLERELADIEARRAAGDVALRAGWGNVQSANAAAAEKARALRAERGDAAAGVWSQAAQQARELAAARAQAAGAFEGRAGIDVSPEAGVADWAGFMESQAPAERALAERQQEMLGQDLDWLAGMAGAQGEAYAGDLRRQASVMSFERARDHNLQVQGRIAQERMMLAQMEQQAQIANAQFAQQAAAQQVDPMQRFNEMVGMAAVMGSPGMLAQQLGVTTPQAQQMIDNFLRGTTQTVLAANPNR